VKLRIFCENQQLCAFFGDTRINYVIAISVRRASKHYCNYRSRQKQVYTWFVWIVECLQIIWAAPHRKLMGQHTTRGPDAAPPALL